MSKLPIIRQTVKEILDLSSKSAILADSKSKQFCKEYNDLLKNDSGKEQKESFTFLKLLSEEHGIKNESLSQTINSLASQLNNKPSESKINLSQSSFEKLNSNLKPEYYNLFQNLGRVSDGVRTLVKIRENILHLLQDTRKNIEDPENEDLKIMNSVLKNMLVLWFSTGLLNVKRIDWNSPASLVEKVAYYESVHKMRTLSDLKSRLSKSRRCFIYTHSTMPFEPLVILHIALTTEVSSNVQSLLKSSTQLNEKPIISNADYTNAIFYSINSCQKGLQQVDLGNALIKSCVRLLLEELPSLKNFHTLSPIPKFREWVDLKLSTAITNDTNTAEYFKIENALKSSEVVQLQEYFQTKENSVLFERMKNYLKSNEFRSNALQVELNECFSSDTLQIASIMAKFLKRSCTFYLYLEKKKGYAFNSVANFHLKNGAQIYRVNFKGDMSDNGWRSSYGFMVNYGYNLAELESNCINYLIEKKIKISDSVKEDLIGFEKVASKI